MKVEKELANPVQIRMTDSIKKIASEDAIKMGMNLSAYLRYLVFMNRNK